MYSAAIADDEINIREGLRDLVDWAGLGFSLAGVFDDGNGLLSLLEKSPPDLIVTDIRMNRCSGLDVSRYIQQNQLPTRVILISGYKEADLAMSAIKYGVKNYILKPIDLDELTDCIQDVYKRQAAASRARPFPAAARAITKIRPLSVSLSQVLNVRSCSPHCALFPPQ